MRRTWLALSLLALSPLPACLQPPGALGHATPHVPGIRIIRAEDAKARGLEGERFDFAFGDNQDGTKLVLDFLDEARQQGARYVSDIRIVIRSRRAGRLLSCESRLRPFAKRESETVPHETPGHTETRYVPKLVTRTVTEYQYRCQMVSRPVTRTETTYQYQYDYLSKSSRSVPVTRTVTSTQYENQCRSEPVTRTVTRYENQLETRYIPPKLTYVAAHYTDFDLIESRPQCAPSEEAPATARLPHRITGTIYK